MSLSNILNIMSSAMSAESMRMNTIASNLANAENVAGSEQEAYRAKHPVFEEVKNGVQGLIKSEQPVGGVRVSEIMQNKQPLEWRLDPNNPLANEDGKVFMTDVNPIEEMADMIAASRQYQASVEVMNTSKNLLLQTVRAIKDI